MLLYPQSLIIHRGRQDGTFPIRALEFRAGFGLDSSPSCDLNRTSKADTNSSVFGSPLEFLIQNSHVWGKAAATQRNADRK